MTNNLPIQLNWKDPITGETRDPRLTPPIAFGREFVRMPPEYQGQRVTRMLLNHDEVSRFHALLEWQHNQLVVNDQGSVNGIYVNGEQLQHSVINSGDTLQIGPYI
ncbi:MAG: FHA domain-containing protein, partial [Cyanobacteria bacterium J06639_18]